MTHTLLLMTSSNTVPVKVEDCLDQDPPIRGQKYVCLSFLSPEDVLRNKEVYLFSQFMKHFADDVTNMFGALKEKFKDDQEVQDMLHNVMERHAYISSDEQMQKEYTYFKDTNSDTLEEEFYAKNNFQTSIRGIKVRGVYESIKEAEVRVQNIRKFDKLFDVFIAEVGCWCPWSPDPSAIQQQEFAEEQLNTLMKKYKENQDIKDEVYASRKEYLVEQNKRSAATVSSTQGDPSTDEDPWLAQKEKSVTIE